MKTISCCINTYKRPTLLIQLLSQLRLQLIDKDWFLEVIVVDNDHMKSAKIPVEEFNNKNTLNVKYFNQPIQNISLTRNKAVQNATGDYILFIDDDGIPEKNWIFELFNCLKNFEADVVFGSVIPYFDKDVPKWVNNFPFYDRLIQNTGEDSKYFRTGNCIIKSEWLKKIEGPFDPKYGLSGGEDSDLFLKLKKLGAKLIFCKEAIVYDYVPKERAKVSWLVKRFFRTGITSISKKINNSNYSFLSRIYYFFRSIILILFSLLILVLVSPIESKRIFWFVKVSSYVGHLAAVFNFTYKGY